MRLRVAARKARATALAAVLALAATASAGVLTFLSSRHAVRVDVTATGEHRLSPRTLRMLDSLEHDYELVLAVDPRRVDRRVFDRLADVLHELERRSERVSLTRVDVATGAGRSAFEGLVSRLGERDRGAVEAQVSRIREATRLLEEASAFLEDLSPRLRAVRDAIPDDAIGAATNRAFFEQRAAVARIGARELRDLRERVEVSLDPEGAALGIPDTGAAARTIGETLRGLEDQLAGLGAEVRRFAGAEAMPPAARDSARPLPDRIGAFRDRVAVTRDRMERLRPPDILRVARALERSEALLVIGPAAQGVTAVDLEALLPGAEVLEAAGVSAGAEIGRRTEELLATALGSLALPGRPIVVLTHGEAREFLHQAPLLDRMVERLGLRGIDVVEWAAAGTAEPPSTAHLDPEGMRPRVFVTLSPDSTAGSRGADDQAGMQRATRLGAALRRLSEEGRPILLSLNPSIFPTYGDDDPIAGVLSRYGLRADSGRPLLRESITARGRLAETDHLLRGVPEGSAHPIAEALRGLATLLPWAIPVARVEDAPDLVRTWPLYEVRQDGSVWAESQWLRMWQTPREQRHLLAEQPRYDEGRDDRRGPWLVAAAAERRRVQGAEPARLVVVGSNSWMIDRVTQQQHSLVDGRVVPRFPGNLELLEASIYWLAGEESLIAQSAAARPIAMVGAMSDADRATLGWLLVGGLPALILILGLAWRVVRG